VAPPLRSKLDFELDTQADLAAATAIGQRESDLRCPHRCG